MADDLPTSGRDWLAQFADTERDRAALAPRLDDAGNLQRLRELSEAVGAPHRVLRPIHIAGTKGKGSCALTIDFLARSLGLTTARFTSPAVEIESDRLALNNRPLDLAEYDRILLDFKAAAAAAGWNDGRLAAFSAFELLTVAALRWMTRARGGGPPDVAIVEAGLGGLLDATNIIERPAVALITSIGLEHTALLGATYREIARHKAGIMKPGAPCVVRRQQESAVREVWAAIDERAELLGVMPYRAEQYVSLVRGAGGDWAASSASPGEPAALHFQAPEHQAYNLEAALAALMAAGYFSGQSPDEKLEWLASLDWTNLRLPGRLEFVREAPPVVLDAAHCPLSVRATVEALSSGHRESGSPPWAVVVGLRADKDAAGIVAEIAKLRGLDEVACISPPGAGGFQAADLVSFFQAANVPANCAESVGLAVAEFLARPSPPAVLVTGSFANIAPARDALTAAGVATRGTSPPASS